MQKCTVGLCLDLCADVRYEHVESQLHTFVHAWVQACEKVWPIDMSTGLLNFLIRMRNYHLYNMASTSS